jgi:hypothetical protein
VASDGAHLSLFAFLSVIWALDLEKLLPMGRLMQALPEMQPEAPLYEAIFTVGIVFFTFCLAPAIWSPR